MLKRILVAVVGIPFLLAVLVAAPEWATMALLCGLCIIGAHELLTAVCGREKTRRWWGLAGTLAVFTVIAVYWSDRRFADTAIRDVAPFFPAALLVLTFIVMVSCAMMSTHVQ